MYKEKTTKGTLDKMKVYAACNKMLYCSVSQQQPKKVSPFVLRPLGST